jgi:FtsZ-interacting cell division protein ZipA
MSSWNSDQLANMSELQISLIAIGFVVVMGVVLFNWMQQRRYKRGAEQVFGSKHEDVLLKTGANSDDGERIEPQLDKRNLEEPVIPDPTPAEPPDRVPPDVVEDLPAESQSSPMPVAAPAPQKIQQSKNTEAVDYVVSIHGDQPVPGFSLAELLQRKMDFGKPARWLGKREASAHWEEITTESNAREDKGYYNLKGCLKLVDRTGPISEVSLSEFRDMAESFALRVNASAICPDIHEAYIQAVLLDEFCTEVDVMIGINIVSRDTVVFTGAKIRMLAEAAGLKLGAEGVFNYYGESGSALFSLGNFELSPFLPASIRTLTTHGVTFLLDVPKVANGEAVFVQMVHLANTFADSLGGVLVDDNRIPLSDSGIGKIRQQLSAIQGMMMARNIPAGSETALRLFA